MHGQGKTWLIGDPFCFSRILVTFFQIFCLGGEENARAGSRDSVRANLERVERSETTVNTPESLKSKIDCKGVKFFEWPCINHQMALLFKDSIARPLHPTDAARNPTILPLDLAGLRRGLATKRLFPICPIVPIGAPHAQLFRSASHAQTSVRPVSLRPANSENLRPDE